MSDIKRMFKGGSKDGQSGLFPQHVQDFYEMTIRYSKTEFFFGCPQSIEDSYSHLEVYKLNEHEGNFHLFASGPRDLIKKCYEILETTVTA